MENEIYTPEGRLDLDVNPTFTIGFLRSVKLPEDEFRQQEEWPREMGKTKFEASERVREMYRYSDDKREGIKLLKTWVAWGSRKEASVLDKSDAKRARFCLRALNVRWTSTDSVELYRAYARYAYAYAYCEQLSKGLLVKLSAAGVSVAKDVLLESVHRPTLKRMLKSFSSSVEAQASTEGLRYAGQHGLCAILM